TYIGSGASPGADNLTNATAVGANAIVSASNAVVLGGTGASAVNVGIGVAAPADALDINNTVGANLIVGYQNGTKKFRVDTNGKGYFDGNIATSGADFAESVAIHGRKSQYEPGDVLEIDPRANRRLGLSHR